MKSSRRSASACTPVQQIANTRNASQVAAETVIDALKQLAFLRTAIFLVVWRISDGPEGLHAIFRYLVNIHQSSSDPCAFDIPSLKGQALVNCASDVVCRSAGAPVILVGTHADRCPTWWLPLDSVARVTSEYFAGSSDPCAFGIPSLKGQALVNCAPDVVASAMGYGASSVLAGNVLPHPCILELAGLQLNSGSIWPITSALTGSTTAGNDSDSTTSGVGSWLGNYDSNPSGCGSSEASGSNLMPSFNGPLICIGKSDVWLTLRALSGLIHKTANNLRLPGTKIF
ncbi:unnamed protein product [Protopolystoma xenopodis]|uniref:Uncharacterized protein n=1 Tax=Protopolystoma xenopodis TaxID=117903 RepID=A0A448XK07_9PLAT|nr:unnamed protein product [Protopolystoma xenopodis]